MKAENPNNSRNVAQFFVKNRQIAWVALFATLAWGVFGYMNMPKRKDPDIPVRIALAITPWPGISADKVEQLVTRKVEQAVTGNSKVDRVESTTQDNISVVQVRLLDNIKNTQQVVLLPPYTHGCGCPSGYVVPVWGAILPLVHTYFP